MSIKWVLSVLFYLIGTGILMVSIAYFRSNFRATAFIMEPERSRIKYYLRMHGILLTFFLVGYVILYLNNLNAVNDQREFLTSSMFLGVSIFVFVGVALQMRIFRNVETTIHELISMCAYCKNIRMVKPEEEGQELWIPVEKFISDHNHKTISHGICPTCYEIYAQPESSKLSRGSGNPALEAS